MNLTVSFVGTVKTELRALRTSSLDSLPRQAPARLSTNGQQAAQLGLGPRTVSLVCCMKLSGTDSELQELKQAKVLTKLKGIRKELRGDLRLLLWVLGAAFAVACCGLVIEGAFPVIAIYLLFFAWTKGRDILSKLE